MSFGLTAFHWPRYAALKHAAQLEAGWDAADALARGSGTLFNLQAGFVWGVLNSACLGRVLKLWSVTWQTVDSQMREFQESFIRSYRYEDVCFSQRDSLILNARAIVVEKLPGSIQKAEGAAFIPTPGEHEL